jgi:hypothetical protein
MQRKLLGIISVDLDITGQLVIIHSACVKYLRKSRNTVSQCISCICIDFKKAYGSVRREILYNILIEFDIPMKLLRLIIMCLNETCSRVQLDTHLSDMFLLRVF